MKNENIETNTTNEKIYSTNVQKEENVSSEVLTDNQIDAIMSASDIQSGEAELVLMQPLDETANVATASVECCDDCNEEVTNVSALGASGTTFTFENNWTHVTLKKGLGAKNGEYTHIAYLFREQIVHMNNIYNNFSTAQKSAMIKLIAHNFFGLLGIFDPTSANNTAKNLAKQILADCGIDFTTEIEMALLGLYELYEAEQIAESHFNTY